MSWFPPCFLAAATSLTSRRLVWIQREPVTRNATAGSDLDRDRERALERDESGCRQHHGPRSEWPALSVVPRPCGLACAGRAAQRQSPALTPGQRRRRRRLDLGIVGVSGSERPCMAGLSVRRLRSSAS